jgi:transcriptional regulator with XRE-family HTH domain
MADLSPDMSDVRAALGDTLRRLRTERHLSTRALAARIGVSPGLISQLETGVTTPSVATLLKLAQTFNVHIRDLFETSAPATAVVRRDARPRYTFPEIGVVDEILSSDPNRQLEVLFGYVEPGGGSGPDLYTHGAVTEFVLVLSGALELRLGADVQTLSAGDSVTFSGDTPHGYSNRGSQVAEFIWAMTPAAY